MSDNHHEDRKEVDEKDSDELLVDLFGTSNVSEMSIVPSAILEEDDEDDDWLDQELEKLEKVRNMLLESTYLFRRGGVHLLLFYL
jgi:hypothetical protein